MQRLSDPATDASGAAVAGPALHLDGVSRHFTAGSRRIPVLEGLNLKLAEGDRVAIMGASGSGKSTLLNLAAGMDRPDGGRVSVCGQALGKLAEPGLTRFRARRIGLVFQDFNLIDSLTAGENIELPLWLTGESRQHTEKRHLARLLGIDDLLERLPGQLSGGEKQRVAIARALVHRPSLVLADEPTGSLDESSAADVLDLFGRITAERGCALILVTHDPTAAAVCERRYDLRGGQLHAG